MASFVSLSGSIVMKSGVKFGRVGILSERKFSLVIIYILREKTGSNYSSVQHSKEVRQHRGTAKPMEEGRGASGSAGTDTSVVQSDTYPSKHPHQCGRAVTQNHIMWTSCLLIQSSVCRIPTPASPHNHFSSARKLLIRSEYPGTIHFLV